MRGGNTGLPEENARNTISDPCDPSQMPKTSTLLIDVDMVVKRHWMRYYILLILTVCSWFNVQVYRIRMCPSAKKGQHFRIDITPAVPARLANLIQFLAGDDRQRVAFNQARIESGLAEWNKLFARSNVRLRTIYRSKVPRRTKRVGKGVEDRG
jgi:hypothetical protein